MAWNRPGGDNNNKDPWGGGKKGPPDLDKMLGDLLRKLRASLHLGNKPSSNNAWQPSAKEFSFGFGLLGAVCCALWALSGLFIVNPAEQAVILRCGQFSETVGPGLHWLVRFVDSKYLVDVQKINSFALQGNFLTKSAEQGDLPNQYVEVKKTTDELAASADKSKNLIDVEMTVQYRVSEPRQFLFNVVDPDKTIQEVTAGALSAVVGKMKLDDVLTTGREMISSGVLEQTKKVLAAYHSGLEVTAITLRKAQAPEQVQAAFNDVNRADQDKATTIQQAQAYASKVVPLAMGFAARTLANAQAYQQQTILLAQAQVSRFEAIYAVYKTAPELTRERIYLETMQQVLMKSNKVLVDVNNSNNLLYLPLDKLISANRAAVDGNTAEEKA